MANNSRDNILDVLVTRLEGIQRKFGFQTDVKTVIRRYREAEDFDISKLPALMVLDDGDETVRDHNTDIGQILSECFITIVGVVRDDSDPRLEPDALSKTFNRFKADLEKKMWGFRTLQPDANAEDIRITGYNLISTLPQYIIFQCNVRFDYWIEKANP